MTLDARSLQDLVTFLIPIMGTEHERTSLYTLAFGLDHPLLAQLVFNGPAQTALTALIQKTLAFGEIRPGVPALWALLEVMRQQVGLDKQSQIDRFRALLGLPPIALPDRVFVSYSRKNETFARRIELELQDAGLKVWFDRFKIRGGDEWRQSIQRGIERADFLVFCLSPDSVASEVCHWELNTAQQSGKLIIPIMLIDCLPLLSEPAQQPIAWLRERHILDFTQPDDYGRRFKELLAALPGYNPPDNYYEDTLDTRQIPNPFRGLEAFRELDYHYFAGRESALADLVARVQDPAKPRLLAVVGASGSGKSSLVRAGLLPTLRDVPHLQWETAVFKPGAQPLLALAERLELRFGQSASELRERFLRNPSSLNELVKSTLSGARDESRFLLVVDQCEEIFAPAADPERQAFLDLLLAAVTVPNGSIHVLLTLRADFFSHLSAYPALASLIEDNLFITTAMTSEQLRRCIEVPAQKVGLIYETGLVEQILEAVREQPGALPLLQYALKELYERRQGRTLTTQVYSDIGGVQGALATRAETIYDQLSDAQKRVMQRLLLQLVEVGDEAVTRRRVRLSLLQLQDITAADVRAVADGLTAEHARLLVASSPISDNDPDNDAEIDLEVSHEALLTHWTRLASWIANDRDDLRRGSEYLQLAQAWHAAGRSETSYLLMGARLATAQDWLTRADATMLQRDFIEASAAHQELDIARLQSLRLHAEEATQRAEKASEEARTSAAHAAIQRRRAQRASLLASFIVIGAIAAVIFGAVQLVQITDKIKEGEIHIESQRLAATAQNLLNSPTGNVETAVLLSIRALKIGYTEQAAAALTQAVDRLSIRKRLALHTGAVRTVAFSPDGKTVLSGSDDNAIILWDVATGQSLRTFTGHTAVVNSVVFSPDGKTILSGSNDRTIILWDVATGQKLHTFTGHLSAVNSVAFSPDGATILSGSDDKTIILWDIAARRIIRKFTGHTAQVWSAAFSPDGKIIISGSSDNTAILWDTITGQILHTFTGHIYPVFEVAFSPDSKTVLIGSGDGTLMLWDISTKRLIQTFADHMYAINSVAFSPDGKTIISGSSEGRLVIWDLVTGQPLHNFTGHVSSITSVAFSPDGTTILSGSDDHTLILWDAVTGLSPHTFEYVETVNSVAFSPDGTTILSGSRSGATVLWGMANGQIQGTIPSPVSSAVFSPDGTTILSGAMNNTLNLWDTATGQVLHTFKGHVQLVTSVAFSPDNKTVLSGSNDGTLILWDAATEKALRIFKGHANGVSSVAFSPDGTTVLSGSNDHTLILWDIATGQALHTFKNHTEAVTSVAFAPDGKTVLSGSYDHTLILWGVATGQALRTFKGHTEAVTSVAFAPDGKTVLSGSDDRTLILWDAATTQVLRIFAGHSYSVRSVAFAPDGKMVLSGSSDFTLRLWETDYRDFPACTRVTRDFTSEERETYQITDDEPTCPQFVSQDHPATIMFPATHTPMATRTHSAEVWTPLYTPTVSMTPTPTDIFGITRFGTRRGEISLGGKQNWLFTGKKEEQITITVLADHPGQGFSPTQWAELGKFDAWLFVYSPDGVLLASNDDIDENRLEIGSVANTDSQLTDLILPASGQYRIEVRSAYQGTTFGAYTLVIEPGSAITATPTAQASFTPTATPEPTRTPAS